MTTSQLTKEQLGPTTLTISSKNYSSWSLRAWSMLKMANIPFIEDKVDIDSPSVKAELLLLAPSILVPCLFHKGIRVWDTLAIGEYLNEIAPKAKLLPTEMVQRAHCRSICGEMHSGFASMRASLPMNLKVKMNSFKVWSKAQADIDRIIEIWSDCLARYGGPYLFGAVPNMADAMFAPVACRFVTYAVKLPPVCENYRDAIMSMPILREWISQAILEAEEFDELDMDF
jgi:glutathione S-transferase